MPTITAIGHLMFTLGYCRKPSCMFGGERRNFPRPANWRGHQDQNGCCMSRSF